MTTKRRTVRVYTKAVDEETREVEQIVSVFENIDLGKDRVKTGAFEGSLARWASSGDPIPVIWSHDWDNPFAHIGAVIEAKELAAGDPDLPPELADLGGLWTKYRVDDAPFADQVFRLLKERRVREASFAYDVLREKKNADGTTDLLELDVIEVGPTLKGMNPATQLLAVKAMQQEAVAELVKASTAEEVGRAMKAVSHTFLPKDEEPERCSICDLTRNTLGHLNLLSADADGAKAVITLTGSVEETADAYFRAAMDHARAEGMGLGGLYALWPEGTYPDEQRAVYLVEGWDDPPGEGAYFEFRFADDPELGLTVSEAVEVTIEGVISPKARRKAVAARRGRKGTTALDDPAVELEDDPVVEEVEETVEGLSPASVIVDVGALELDEDLTHQTEEA